MPPRGKLVVQLWHHRKTSLITEASVRKSHQDSEMSGAALSMLKPLQCSQGVYRPVSAPFVCTIWLVKLFKLSQQLLPKIPHKGERAHFGPIRRVRTPLVRCLKHVGFLFSLRLCKFTSRPSFADFLTQTSRLQRLINRNYFNFIDGNSTLEDGVSPTFHGTAVHDYHGRTTHNPRTKDKVRPPTEKFFFFP
jgi:hypothetical protein